MRKALLVSLSKHEKCEYLTPIKCIGRKNIYLSRNIHRINHAGKVLVLTGSWSVACHKARVQFDGMCE